MVSQMIALFQTSGILLFAAGQDNSIRRELKTGRTNYKNFITVIICYIFSVSAVLKNLNTL